VRIAKAVHVDGFNADAGTTIATVTRADAVAGVFLAMAPFVEGVVLATHGGRVNLVRDMHVSTFLGVLFSSLQEQMCGVCRIHLNITSSEDSGVVCGESLGMRNGKPRWSGTLGDVFCP
jgi:hypothetical protein